MKGKLAPRYIYEVVKRIGLVVLPPHLTKIHDVFHVYMLRKAEIDPAQVLTQVPIEIEEDLTIDVKPVKILDRSGKELRNKKIPLVKVLWRSSLIDVP
jgi:hypothetical protein